MNNQKDLLYEKNNNKNTFALLFIIFAMVTFFIFCDFYVNQQKNPSKYKTNKEYIEEIKEYLKLNNFIPINLKGNIKEKRNQKIKDNNSNRNYRNNSNSEDRETIVLKNISLAQQAIDNGDIESLKYIIKEDNVNVNDIIYEDYSYDLLDYSLAVMKPKAEIVDIIIKLGADVNRATNNNGQRPLHIITQRSDIGDPVDIVQVLISSGADVNATDAKGRYAIVQAVIKGHVETLRLFVNSGADIKVKNSQNYSLMKIAIMQKYNTKNPKYDKIIDILKNAGATE